jgi:hypothetical protein
MARSAASSAWARKVETVTTAMSVIWEWTRSEFYPKDGAVPRAAARGAGQGSARLEPSGLANRYDKITAMTSPEVTSSESSRHPKIFVLDTSVILYDANAIFNFKEHDVAIPITVLEELDHFKKGDTVINLQAREFIRQLDKLTSHDMLNNWVPLDGPELGRIRVVAEEEASTDARLVFGSGKNDHRILNTALALREREAGRDVILVSKDINLRVKARALHLRAEEYETVRIKDVDHLYKGKSEIEVDDAAPIQKFYESGGVSPADVGIETPFPNHYFILRSPSHSALAWFNPGLRAPRARAEESPLTASRPATPSRPSPCTRS